MQDAAAQSKHFERRRARELLGTLEQREAEIAAQQAARLSRFDNAIGQPSLRSDRAQKLLREGQQANAALRSPRGKKPLLGAIQPGAGMSPGGPRPPRNLGGRKKFTADDWLK